MTPLNRKFRAGLAALGLLGTAAMPASAQESVPPMPAPRPAPAPPNAPAFAVLLLSNGRLLQGNVTENAAGDAYELRMKGGLIPVPKKDVARVFGSMVELYQDKAAHLPDRDPDERMKLALWCLEQHMEPQAREQLRGVLAINPSDQRAARMIASIDANSLRAEARDPAVLAAGAEVVAPAPRDEVPASPPLPRPRTAVGRAAARPVIFDLPPDVAMKRFAEFAWDVHPILQASCASCHNEGYAGEYRLIAGRSRKDWTADVVRANLDATLRYVRRDDPTHSDLVAYAANPHGPSPRPIFHGANDARYRRLMAWLQLLRPAEPVARAGYAPAPAATAPPSAGFGADRIPGPPAGPTPAVPMPSPPAVGPLRGQASYQYRLDAVAPGVPGDVTFDPPNYPGALRPPLPAPPGTTPVPSPTAGPRASTAAPAPAAPAAARLPDLPPGTPVPPPDDVIPPTNRAKKSGKMDPALLEKVLKSRQQGQP